MYRRKFGCWSAAYGPVGGEDIASKLSPATHPPRTPLVPPHQTPALRTPPCTPPHPPLPLSANIRTLCPACPHHGPAISPGRPGPPRNCCSCASRTSASASRAPGCRVASTTSTPSSTPATCACSPHVWISDEWFSPDNVPGIAIPFYLAHPRLMRLERSQMLEVEGGTVRRVHADPAARVRPCRPACLSAAPAARVAAALRQVVHQVPRVVPAEPGQQEVRPAPAPLVCAEPSGRGLRRDVRRLARPAFRLAASLRRLARAPEAASTSTT